jgi:hypothetical protein
VTVRTLARTYGASETQLALPAAREEAEDGRLAHLIGPIVAIDNGNRVMVSRRIPSGGHTP